ncbi:MAG: hypothetical protein SNJ09_04885 [Rikenellaceae bacterium]
MREGVCLLCSIAYCLSGGAGELPCRSEAILRIAQQLWATHLR